jgi:hypothetical protein
LAAVHRGFALGADERHLRAANPDSDDISVFQIDQTGRRADSRRIVSDRGEAWRSDHDFRVNRPHQTKCACIALL